MKVLRRLERLGLLYAEQDAFIKWLQELPVTAGSKDSYMLTYKRWLKYSGIKPTLSLIEYAEALDRLKSRKLAKIPSYETAVAVINKIRGRTRWLLLFLLETGLRLSEALNLRWTQIEKDKLIMEESEKRSEGSILPLSPLAILCLNSVKKYAKSSDDLVFKLRPRTIYRCLSNAKKKMVGLPGVELVNPKNLRHLFATRLYASTHDLIYVQRMLRHRSILTTQRYVHMVISRKDYDVRVVPIHDKETIATLLSEGYDYVTQTKDSMFLRRLKDI